MMALVCSSLGPTFLGLSELPGLLGSLFPLPDWGSSPSLFVQVSFQFLAAVLLFLAPLWFGYWNISGCHRDFSASHQFFEFLFLHSVLVRFLFLPFVPNCWFESRFSSLHCWFPVCFSFIYTYIDYAITVVPFPPLHSTPSCPPPPSHIPPLQFMSIGHTYKFFDFYIS